MREERERVGKESEREESVNRTREHKGLVNDKWPGSECYQSPVLITWIQMGKLKIG